jgi:hypothetical protein
VRGRELDEERVLLDDHVVTRGQVVRLTGDQRLLRAVGRGDAQAAADDVAPMRALARVVGQPLEQRGGLDARAQALEGEGHPALLDRPRLGDVDLELDRDLLLRIGRHVLLPSSS